MRKLRAAATRQTQRSDTERDILKAAERLLSTRPFSDLSTDAVMAEAGLSRTAFYRYFPDIASLILRLYADVRAEVAAAAHVWLREDLAPREAIEQAFTQIADVYTQHGIVLKAVGQAAAIDPEIDAVYSQSATAFADAIHARLKRDRALTVLTEADENETAISLMWMIERYFSRELVGADAARSANAVDTLTSLWARALYDL